jgi:hypothetical protein
VAGFADTSAAIRTLAGFRARLASLEAAELFYADGLALVRGYAGLADAAPRRSCRVPAGRVRWTPRTLRTSRRSGCRRCGVADAVVVSDARGRADLWRYREAHTEAISAVGVPVKLDVAVPVGALAAFVAELVAKDRRAVAPGARVIVFGHLAEGNLHVNVLDTARRVRGARSTDTVLRAVVGRTAAASAPSTASAGRRCEWLGLSRSPAEIAAMTAVKRALDPDLAARSRRPAPGPVTAPAGKATCGRCGKATCGRWPRWTPLGRLPNPARLKPSAEPATSRLASARTRGPKGSGTPADAAKAGLGPFVPGHYAARGTHWGCDPSPCRTAQSARDQSVQPT